MTLRSMLASTPKTSGTFSGTFTSSTHYEMPHQIQVHTADLMFFAVRLSSRSSAILKIRCSLVDVTLALKPSPTDTRSHTWESGQCNALWRCSKSTIVHSQSTRIFWCDCTSCSRAGNTILRSRKTCSREQALSGAMRYTPAAPSPVRQPDPLQH